MKHDKRSARFGRDRTGTRWCASDFLAWDLITPDQRPNGHELHGLGAGHGYAEGPPDPEARRVISRLIEIFTDPGDVVIDPVAGSGVTLVAAESLGRKSFGFEIKKEFVRAFEERLAPIVQQVLI